MNEMIFNCLARSQDNLLIITVEGHFVPHLNNTTFNFTPDSGLSSKSEYKSLYLHNSHGKLPILDRQLLMTMMSERKQYVGNSLEID